MIQRAVDRRFYRSGYDAQAAVDGFSERLREQIDLDALCDELRSVVAARCSRRMPACGCGTLAGGQGTLTCTELSLAPPTTSRRAARCTTGPARQTDEATTSTRC